MRLTTNITFDSCIKENGKYLYEIHIDNPLLSDITFKFRTNFYINDDYKIEIHISDILYDRDNIDGVMTDIQRVWIGGRYLDSNRFSARCVQIGTGKKAMTLVRQFPAEMVYWYNKRPEEKFGAIELVMTNKKEFGFLVEIIPVGFVRI